MISFQHEDLMNIYSTVSVLVKYGLFRQSVLTNPLVVEKFYQKMILILAAGYSGFPT